MSELIEPYENIVSPSRNQTERSRIAENILDTFLKYGATAARVRWQETSFTLDELHRGLWNACQKDPFNRSVRVTKRGDELILLRKVKNDTN